MGTMPVAMEAFFESKNFEDAIRNAISIGGGSDITESVADLRKTLPKSQVKDGLLANMTGRIDSWLKENGLVK